MYVKNIRKENLMEENKAINEAVNELKGADETKLKEIVEKWFDETRTAGMKIGAYYISAGVYGIIQKHLKKGKEPSRRDFERCVDEILKVVSVQLNTQQNDLEESNDGSTSEGN